MSKSYREQRGQARTKRPERTQVEMHLAIRRIVGLDGVVSAHQGDRRQCRSRSNRLERIEQAQLERYGVVPEDYLVDGGFSKSEDITFVEGSGTAVLAPLYAEQKQLDEGKDPYAARAKESPEMTAHRARMGTPEAKFVG